VRRALAVALLGALVVGAAAAATGKPIVRTNPRDVELAQTVALRNGDLPATFKGGYVKASVVPISCPGFAPKQSDLTVTGYAGSAFADSKGSVVSSLVEVYADPAQVARDWARTIRPPLAHCLGLRTAQALRGTLRSARKIPSPPVEPKTAAYRIVVGVGKRTVTEDVILFAEGRVEATVALKAVGRAPSAQLERLVAGLVATRFD
jgi:hypothetical protein